MLKRVLIIVCIFGVVMTAPLGVLSGSTADEAIEYLRSANELRSQRSSEEQSWQLERERQELLLATLADELKRIETKQGTLKAQIATLEVERPTEIAKNANQIESLMTEIASHIERELERRAPTLPPGALPTPLIDRGTPAETLASAMKSLSEAERRAGQVSIELVEGTLDGQARSVELLRLGGLAAWWTSLDGGQAGTASMVQGALTLQLEPNIATRDAISQAIRIARGRAAPSLVTLPYLPISRVGEAP